MTSIVNWTVLVFIICHTVGAQKRFDGHKVFRVQPQNEDEIKEILRLQHVYGYERVDFWKEPSDATQPTDIMVSPDIIDEILDLFKRADIPHSVMIDNVQPLIDNQLQRRRRHRRRRSKEMASTEFDYGIYHTYDEITDWTNRTAHAYSGIAKRIKIGKSFEKRKIYALKISTNVRRSSKKRSVFMVGGFHAREWISPATVMYITNQLLSNYDSDSAMRRLVDEIDWYIVPLANPDGYSFTWTGGRMWRKTRSIYRGNKCVGTDPNRNWKFHWGGTRDDVYPCSNTYKGPRPFSEREVRRIAYFLRKQKKQFDAYLDFHSYGQKWMTAWSFTQNRPRDFAELRNVSQMAVDAIATVNGTIYTPEQVSHIFQGNIIGSAIDWTYGAAGIKYSFGIELRDTGRHGFLLPEDQIIDTGIEITEAVKVIGFHLIGY